MSKVSTFSQIGPGGKLFRLANFLLSVCNKVFWSLLWKIYSINEGSYNSFEKPVKDYISFCKEKNYTGRYIGSLVADFHRNLLKGGIYIYPATAKDPKGKLRLMYECNALAFIAEQAGGKASTGTGRILDLEPKQLHQRTPFFVGSKNMVIKAESLQGTDGTGK